MAATAELANILTSGEHEALRRRLILAAHFDEKFRSFLLTLFGEVTTDRDVGKKKREDAYKYIALISGAVDRIWIDEIESISPRVTEAEVNAILKGGFAVH